MANRSTPHPDPPPGRTPRKVFEDGEFNEDEATENASDSPTIANEAESQIGGDTGFDRIVGPEEAGLGGGLDQAEEARLGITDEELAEMARHTPKLKK